MERDDLIKALLQLSTMLLSGDLSLSSEETPVVQKVTPPAPVAPSTPSTFQTPPSEQEAEAKAEAEPRLRIDYDALASVPGSEADALRAIRDTIEDLKEPIQIQQNEQEGAIYVHCSELAMNKIVQRLQHSGIRWVNLKPAK